MSDAQPSPVVRITVAPTGEFFNATDVLVRAWTGETDNGDPVVAFICGIAAPDGTPAPGGLTPTPAPGEKWDDASRSALGALWRLIEGMDRHEVMALATLIDDWMGMPPIRRLYLLRNAMLAARDARADPA